MNVLPITDSKKQVTWISPTKPDLKTKTPSFYNLNQFAFISPAENMNNSHDTNAKSERRAKKGKPLSNTSENWIG